MARCHGGRAAGRWLGELETAAPEPRWGFVSRMLQQGKSIVAMLLVAMLLGGRFGEMLPVVPVGEMSLTIFQVVTKIWASATRHGGCSSVG